MILRALILFCSLAALAGPPPVPVAIRHHKAVSITQGAAALQNSVLLNRKAVVKLTAIPISKVIVPPANVYYFALLPNGVTNCNANYSTFTNTVGYRSALLTWDWATNWVCSNPPTNTYSNVVAWGKSPAARTNFVNAGTNSSILISLFQPPRTNVLNMTAQLWQPPNGPWGPITSWPVVSFTNTPPQSVGLYRIMAEKNGSTYTVSGQVARTLPAQWSRMPQWFSFTTTSNYDYRILMVRTNL